MLEDGRVVWFQVMYFDQEKDVGKIRNPKNGNLGRRRRRLFPIICRQVIWFLISSVRWYGVAIYESLKMT
jgi:hypothetical protein